MCLLNLLWIAVYMVPSEWTQSEFGPRWPVEPNCSLRFILPWFQASSQASLWFCLRAKLTSNPTVHVSNNGRPPVCNPKQQCTMMGMFENECAALHNLQHMLWWHVTKCWGLQLTLLWDYKQSALVCSWDFVAGPNCIRSSVWPISGPNQLQSLSPMACSSTWRAFCKLLLFHGPTSGLTTVWTPALSSSVKFTNIGPCATLSEGAKQELILVPYCIDKYTQEYS